MKIFKRIELRSVGMKVFFVLFLTVVLLSTALGLSSYFMSREIIRDQVSIASSQAIEQAADKLDFLFTEYESTSRQLAVDAQLRTDLESVTKPDIHIREKVDAETRIKNKLEALRGSDERLHAIRLVKKDLSSSYSSSGAAGTQSNERVLARMDTILEAEGKSVWIPTLKKGFFDNYVNEPVITMGRLLQNMKNPNAEYVLMIEIKDKALAETLSGLTFGKSGEVRILTEDNTIVHASNPEFIESISYIGTQQAGTGLHNTSSSFTMKDRNGTMQLVVYKQLETTKWNMVGYAPESDFLSAADRLISITVMVLIIAVVVAFIIGYYLFRMVGKPLQKLSLLMEEGERGNLQVRTDFKSRDEIGRLGLSFNRMIEQISILVERTNSSTESLLTTAENLTKVSRSTSQTAGEVAAATEEIADGAASLALEAEKGTDLIDKIGSQMNRVVELNTAMDESAGRVIQVSSQGREYMEQLVEKTDAVSRMTGIIEENSGKLSESTLQIRGILAPMIEMTKRTNILSLNASIEASRAGNAGKGFMVIAEEIRNLSAQSNESIQNVSEMTEDIQAAIEDTVNVLMGVTPLFDEQLTSVKEASSIFQRVSKEMESFIGELQNSSSSVKELIASQSALSDFIGSVSAVAQQTNASTEEVASMSSEQHKVSEELVRLSNRLEELSELLKQSLSAFQVDSID